MKASVQAAIYEFATQKKLCLYLSLLVFFAIPVEAKDTPPNILFIVADNQPASILGAYGNPDVKTPNIDRLAKEGMRFTGAFAVHGMCSPTRATMLTGLLPSQHGVHDWLDDEEMADWPGDWNAIREYRNTTVDAQKSRVPDLTHRQVAPGSAAAAERMVRLLGDIQFGPYRRFLG